MARVEEPPIPPDDVVDDADSAADAAVVASPELVANTLGEYLRASIQRVRGGDAGVLPVILGLFLISAIFQSLNSNFLSAGNLVNLLVQGAVFMLLAMGEVFVLLLGEIDLSVGFVAGLGGVIGPPRLRHAPSRSTAT